MESRQRRRAQRNRHETRVIEPLLIEPCMKRPMCHSVRAPCVWDAAKTRRSAGSLHDENAVPEILMDCNFARRDDETETVTLLVVEDHYSEPSKHGSSSEKAQISMPLNVIQRAVKGLRSFGHHGRVAIKADNEPAILALKEEIMRRPEGGAIPVESVPVIRRTTALMKLL